MVGSTEKEDQRSGLVHSSFKPPAIHHPDVGDRLVETAHRGHMYRPLDTGIIMDLYPILRQVYRVRLLGGCRTISCSINKHEGH